MALSQLLSIYKEIYVYLLSSFVVMITLHTTCSKRLVYKPNINLI